MTWWTRERIESMECDILADDIDMSDGELHHFMVLCRLHAFSAELALARRQLARAVAHPTEASAETAHDRIRQLAAQICELREQVEQITGRPFGMLAPPGRA